MLPVALDVPSVPTPPTAQAPGGKTDSEGSTQFADMLDQFSASQQLAKETPSGAGTLTPSDKTDKGVDAATALIPVSTVDIDQGEVIASLIAQGGEHVEAGENIETTPPNTSDSQADDKDLPVVAFLATIAQVTDAPVKPIASTKSDTENADDVADGDDKVKKKETDGVVITDGAPKVADSMTNVADGTPKAAAVVITPIAGPSPVAPGTASASDESAVKSAPVIANGAPIEVDGTIATDVVPEAQVADNQIAKDQVTKAETDSTKLPASAKTDTPSPAPEPLKAEPARHTTRANQPLVDQTLATGGDRPAPVNATAQAAPTAKPLPDRDQPTRDAVPATKTADTPQSIMLVQANGIASPAPTDRTMATSAPTQPQAVALPVAGIAVEIAGKALAGKNRFEIRLDPPELGRIHVRLDVDRNGEVTSHITADRSDTFDLLRRDAPDLQRALQDAGVRTANNGLQFSLRDHGFGRHDQPMAHSARVVVADVNLEPEIAVPAYRPLAGTRAGIDIRV